MDNSGEYFTMLLILSISLFVIAVIVVIFFGIIQVIKIKRREFVVQNSEKIRLVGNLGVKYQFYEVSPNIDLKCCCSSKREFDRTNFYEFFFDCISIELDHYKTIISMVLKNRELYDSYNADFNAIVSSVTVREQKLYLKYGFFEKTEAAFCDKKKLLPTTSLKINVVKTYVSPMGRNYYQDSCAFSLNDLVNCCNDVEIYEKNKKTTKYQRENMGDSLRYDILKRDGFRCVICGASQQDGVKLHVDHIFPVSKGGKTEPSNLRTLCERCNRGKSDKFDPLGLN